MKIYILLLVICAGWRGPYHPVPGAYTLATNYQVSIHGTFSIHSWTETIQNVSGDLGASVNEDGSANLQSIRMVMETHSIKSDMGATMNNKTYKALKADAAPHITFLLAAPTRISPVKPGSSSVSLQGVLSLAGVSRPVTMWISSFKIVHGTFSIEGILNIKMTDFGIKPPTALFGTMKAGPDITINFKTDFTTNQK